LETLLQLAFLYTFLMQRSSVLNAASPLLFIPHIRLSDLLFFHCGGTPTENWGSARKR
jgi:hypothetical protein